MGVSTAWPHRYSVGVRRWHEGEPTPHGYGAGYHGDPEPTPVFAFAPGPSEEEVAAGRRMSEVAWTVYAPAGTVVGARDLVVLNGVEYEADGDSRDYSFGPWSSAVAGVVFALKARQG